MIRLRASVDQRMLGKLGNILFCFLTNSTSQGPPLTSGRRSYVINSNERLANHIAGKSRKRM